MIEKHAAIFASGFGMLAETKLSIGLWSQENNDGPLTEPLRNLANASIHDLRVGCILSDMGDAIPALDRLSVTVNSPPGWPQPPASAVALEMKHLLSTLKDKLTQEFYFHLDQRDVSYYLMAEPFGENISRKFPKAIEDIAEASKCLALQRPTAAVFHLMRVMELALRALAKKLKVTTIDPNVESWNNITNHVNKAINSLPGKTTAEQSRKARFGAAIAHLNSVRIAWRNEVMHPKQSYSREEAHTIFNAVRAFMIELAALK